MNVFVASVFDCPAEKVWNEVQKSSLLQEIIFPLARVVPVGASAFPERWKQGETIVCQSCLFGVIPIGTRALYFERIDHARQEIQTREQDALIQRWDHLIRVEPTDDGRTCYSDTIAIEAGWLMPLVWLFAQCFYRHRQKRWRRIAKRLATAESSELEEPVRQVRLP
jgi:ligand-binding SRPBCC domain-containing protein